MDGFVFLVRRGLSQEAKCSGRDPTSSHDLRKWERGAHRDGQHAAKRREQTAAGHRKAPGPHTCHRGLRHPGRGRAFPCVYTEFVCLVSHLYTRFWVLKFLSVFVFDWQVCGPVKDSAGEDLPNDSPDTNQSETVTTATGISQTSLKAQLPSRRVWRVKNGILCEK